jgi:chromosome segregation ATPase
VKLSTYFEKPVPVKPRESKRIIVSNDGVKKKFMLQIQQLEDRNSTLQDNLLKEQTAEKSLREIYRNTNEELRKTQTSLHKLDSVYLENAQLQKRIKQLEALEKVAPELELTLQKERLELASIRKEHHKTVETLATTETLLGEAKSRAASLYTESKKHRNRADVLEEKYPLEQAQRKRAFAQIETLEEIQKGLEKDIDNLSNNFFYWKDKADLLDERLEAESQLRDEIQASLDMLSRENVLESKKVTKVSAARKEAQDLILDLQNRNIDLTKFADQLSKIILEQKKQLASAGRLSQGTIGVKEGFHIPFAKENLRTRQLGNALPTLLKFKETTNDNN